MKLVCFIDHLRPDGTQQVLRQLIAGLTSRGHLLAVVCLNDSYEPTFVARLQALGAEVRIVGKAALLNGSGWLTTLIWLRARNFDAALTLLFFADVIGQSMARTAGIPLRLTSIQNRNTDYSYAQRLAARLTSARADIVVSCSARALKYSIAHEGIRPERTVVIPNSIAIERYCRPIPRGALLDALALPDRARVLGYVARLYPQKAVDVLLTALAQLATPDVVLLLCGVGPLEAELRALAERLGVAERVHWLGYRNDVPQLLGALDLYVHPSRFEGMSLAVLEAMAAGCPIVATAIDGTVETIDDGVEGWLIPPDDAHALAHAIDLALADPAEARRRGARARARATRDHDEPIMIDRWERLLTVGLEHAINARTN